METLLYLCVCYAEIESEFYITGIGCGWDIRACFCKFLSNRPLKYINGLVTRTRHSFRHIDSFSVVFFLAQLSILRIFRRFIDECNKFHPIIHSCCPHFEKLYLNSSDAEIKHLQYLWPGRYQTAKETAIRLKPFSQTQIST